MISTVSDDLADSSDGAHHHRRDDAAFTHLVILDYIRMPGNLVFQMTQLAISRKVVVLWRVLPAPLSQLQRAFQVVHVRISTMLIVSCMHRPWRCSRCCSVLMLAIVL